MNASTPYTDTFLQVVGSVTNKACWVIHAGKAVSSHILLNIALGSTLTGYDFKPSRAIDRNEGYEVWESN